MAILDEVLQTLEIQPTGIPTVVRLSQNENGRQIRLTLRGNEDNFPAGCLVTIAGTKPDGVVYSASGELDGNVAVINEDTQMTAVAGMWKARVQVTYGGSTIATELIVFEVYADPVDPDSVPSESELNGLVAEAQYWAENARSSAYGSPLTANTAAEMTETDRVYVYTGSETGYTAGHWYYYDAGWQDGGVYMAGAVQTDTTLSVPGMPADAKATGDELSQRFALSSVNRVLIPANSDLNDYTTPGNYMVRNSATAQSITHCPSTLGGTVFVLTGTASTAFVQIYLAQAISNGVTFFIRGKAGSTAEWGEWYKLTQNYDAEPTAGSENLITSGNIYNALAEKADAEGESPNLVAGSANAILSDSYTEDSVPYKFRQTPMNSKRMNEKIIGGTVAWNQLIPVSTIETATATGVTVTNNGDGSFTLTGTPSNSNAFRNLNYTPGQNNCGLIADHVYYLPKGNTSPLAVGVRLNNMDGDPSSISADTSSRIFKVASVGTQSYVRLQVTGLTNTDIGTVIVKPQFFDLTAMFGSTIADYLYNLEQTTAGAGVALFKSLFNADYYAYNAGELKSIEGLSAHKMRDANSNVIGNYPLDDSLTLRGVLKLVNNKIKFDGDVYAPDGTVTRRYGIVDLGSKNYTYLTSYDEPFFRTTIDRAYGSQVAVVCAKYAFYGVSSLAEFGTSTVGDKMVAIQATNNGVCFKDSAYTDKDAFKASLSGVYLVYELETATTENAQPYQEIQICDPDGTEEYVSTGIVPIGHETKYYKDIISAIEGIPDAPTANGTYVLKCIVSGGVATYSWEV